MQTKLVLDNAFNNRKREDSQLLACRLVEGEIPLNGNLNYEGLGIAEIFNSSRIEHPNPDVEYCELEVSIHEGIQIHHFFGKTLTVKST